MKIVRFLDEKGDEFLGAGFDNGRARILSGSLLGRLEETGKTATVSRLLSPLQPAAVLCIGLNYRAHARETGIDLPRYPVLFMKNPASVTGHETPIVLPDSCRDPLQVDYEAELAVVIGKAARNVSAENALDYVLGFTAANDVSARRWQKHAGGGQWVRGKSFDTFCPLGPELVTIDEFDNPNDLGLKCLLNGKVMQEGRTSDMIFSVARLVEYLSQDMTLLPGSIILTGTPSGVGFTREPPVYLAPGDRVEVHLEGVGVLSNHVE